MNNDSSNNLVNKKSNKFDKPVYSFVAGILAILLGVGITLGSYFSAREIAISHHQTSFRYVIFWYPIAFGIVAIVNGFVQLFKKNK